jgi:hypothetical protein
VVAKVVTHQSAKLTFMGSSPIHASNSFRQPENSQLPATKQDLEQLRSEFHHGLDDLKESMRDNQTEILKAF